ncbi:MAG: efflux RND transporter periplasmic adaptor subunit [Aurantimonas endophytica]|uniref:Membrane fusion protein (Multidrug efflux system) n=1 Tax=Aurantimonas endophytica TaxID=1522175 RepID=A0A7W6HF81_9HYPH|nr:efflux RND transporter periplasmic adaptor subunit [Aurantimonas endophytica]MBB4004124.1 membrane fusion protein (multidrug efflux system) [Aurantimonas endophytica]MCO6404968.1 efflux RND transporter periplasmic adaptor subunit [Aurantimonas endophytica]
MSGSRAFLRIAALTGLLVAAGVPAHAQGGGETPPPAVTVMTIQSRTLPVTYEYAGRVAASREVEVRARVGGILLQREFEEGARIAQGTLLFRIDSAPYEAQVALAKAEVMQAEAQLGQAQRTEERARTLAQSGASSRAALDDAVSARELAAAQVAAAEAQLRTATLSLGYATVEAPVSGITSLEQVPEGSLLSTGDLLTRISQLDPIYVNFSAADREAASIRDLIDSGRLQGGTNPSDLKVTIAFGDGATYEQSGTIDFTSTSIDSQTGTILSRAVLPNPDDKLLPGQFVRLQLEGLSVENAVTVPTEALMQGPQGTFVYTVNAENVAEVRPVRVDRELNGSLLLADGLQDGDRVIVEGVVKVRPNAPVAPHEAEEAPAGGQPANAPEASAGPEEGAAEPPAAGTPEAPEAAEDAAPATGDSSALESDAETASADASAGPPVPLTALPDGQAARDEQNGAETGQ